MKLYIVHQRSSQEADDYACIYGRLTTLLQATAALATALNERFDVLEGSVAAALADLKREVKASTLPPPPA